MPLEHDLSAWPALPFEQWKDTCDTLHMWTQIVGKTRLAFAPMENHWWEVPLYVSARGLNTSSIPCKDFVFDVEFDFIKHQLCIRKSSGEEREVRLFARPVAYFYAEYMRTLHELGIEPDIYGTPVEVAGPVPFAEDVVHASYDPEWAHRFWQVLLRADTALKKFHGRWLGKSSPVHFFWGSFDLAVTRFNGKKAPERPEADAVTREAYSHEVISCGFWPGNGGFGEAAFYCYAAPEPPGLKEKPNYDPTLNEFILKYEDARNNADPEQAVLDFCQSKYETAAALGKWNRRELERSTSQQ